MSFLRIFQFDYDDDFDVLYIKLKGSEIEHSEEINGGIFASYSPDEEIVGFIVMDLTERSSLPLGVYSKIFSGISLEFIRSLLENETRFELYRGEVPIGESGEGLIDTIDFADWARWKEETIKPLKAVASCISYKKYESTLPSMRTRPWHKLLMESENDEREENLAA